ncbi:MAG: hypothetical protein JW819_04350 [Candidatus Krumholzibacteriota bacterium]|nr:hypothetical protein [Candidatus Krumholzibacteriota bacterium]
MTPRRRSTRGPDAAPRRCAARRLAVLAAAVAVLPAAGVPATGAVLFDFEQPAFIERGYRVKDHCLIHDGTRFHLFHIRGRLADADDPSLGHAVSDDLRRWRHEAPALAAAPGTFADFSLWAPQVLPADSLPAAWRPDGGRWAMLFTGVTGAMSQSIGLAWSADLSDWTMQADPVYTPGAWADWSAAGWGDCRDPFAFAAADSLFLLATARAADGRGALALAAASGAAFTDLGPLLVAPDDGALESPQLVRAGAWWYLLVTRGGVHGTSVLRAPDWRGPWDLAAAVRIDEGAAPEVNRFSGAVLAPTGWPGCAAGARIFSRHENYHEWGVYNFAIQFDTIDLADGLWPPPITDRQGFDGGLSGWIVADLPDAAGPNPFALAPTFEDNPAARGAAASGYRGHSWLSSFEAYRSVAGDVASDVGDTLGAAAVGALLSPAFVVTGERLDFLLGGAGDADSCWVALRRTSDGALLHRAAPPGGTGTGVPGGEGLPLAPRAWDLRPLRGLSVFLEIRDGARGPGGFIAADDFAWSDGDPAAGEPPLVAVPARGFEAAPPWPSPWRPAAGPLRLSLRVDRPGAYAGLLFDARGRRAARVAASARDAGAWELDWSAPPDLASGLYVLRWEGPGGRQDRRLVILR